MAEYSKKSIINIANDKLTVEEGSVVQSGGKLILGANSKCSFTYDYDAKNNSLQANSFIIKYNIENSESGMSSRYNPKVVVNIFIQYFEETKDESGNTIDYIEGDSSVYSIYPYYNDELDGFIDMVCISTQPTLIKRVKVEIRIDSENSTVIRELLVSKELNTEGTIQENLAIDIILEEVIKYRDGLTLRFNGADDLDLWWLGLTDNSPTEIDVNHTKRIKLTDRKDETKPL